MQVELPLDDLLMDHARDQVGACNLLNVESSIRISASRIIKPCDGPRDSEDFLGNLDGHQIRVVVVRHRNERIGEFDSCPSKGPHVVRKSDLGSTVERGSQHGKCGRILLHDRYIVAVL